MREYKFNEAGFFNLTTFNISCPLLEDYLVKNNEPSLEQTVAGYLLNADLKSNGVELMASYQTTLDTFVFLKRVYLNNAAVRDFIRANQEKICEVCSLMLYVMYKIENEEPSITQVIFEKGTGEIIDEICNTYSVEDIMEVVKEDDSGLMSILQKPYVEWTLTDMRDLCSIMEDDAPDQDEDTENI